MVDRATPNPAPGMLRRSLREGTMSRTAASFELHELEPRRLLSTAVTRPSFQDRQELLANWAGPNATYLRRLLARGYTGAFDQALLSYMQTRVGPRYFFSPSDVPGDIAFVQSHLPQQVTSAIGGADQTVGHLFPLQVNS